MFNTQNYSSSFSYPPIQSMQAHDTPLRIDAFEIT